jgi:hypothetical protein
LLLDIGQLLGHSIGVVKRAKRDDVAKRDPGFVADFPDVLDVLDAQPDVVPGVLLAATYALDEEPHNPFDYFEFAVAVAVVVLDEHFDDRLVVFDEHSG